MKAFERTPERMAVCLPALDALRQYLDDIRFHSLFQYQTGINNYALTPSVFTYATRGALLRLLADSTSGGAHTLGLVKVLCAAERVAAKELLPTERALANRLVDAGLLAREGDALANAGVQLISSHGCYLFIDTRIHFCEDSVHDVYIGVDSYLLLFYLEPYLKPGAAPFLDLCSGSGVVGQAAAARGLSVVSTDIAPAPLFLIEANRRLNHRTTEIEIREEPLETTLEAPAGSYGFVACNPPFVAFPDSIAAPVYAKGTDPDGLGMLRTLFEKGPDAMTDDGLCAFVADMPGDEVQPHFIAELREIAVRKRLRIDVFVDSRLPAEKQVAHLPGFMALCNRDRSATEMQEEFRAFVRDTLRASHYYLCTMLARRAAVDPGVRVLNRHAMRFVNDFFGRRMG
jgi:tRNA1(Val) A37 N6-methylase TrmN6